MKTTTLGSFGKYVERKEREFLQELDELLLAGEETEDVSEEDNA